MNEKLQQLLQRVQATPDFCYVTFDSINATNELGDNALHCACGWGDYEAARLLVESGIELNQRGESGFTPLNLAVDHGFREIADYLIAQGANPQVIGAAAAFDQRKYARHLKRLEEQLHAMMQKFADDRAGAAGHGVRWV